MKSRFKKHISAILCITLMWNATVVWADENGLQNQLDKNKQEIEDLQNQKDEVNDEISKETTFLKEIEAEIASKNEELQRIQREVDEFAIEIEAIQVEIDGIQSEINFVEEQIKISEEKINSLIEEQRLKEDMLKDRIRNYYKLDVSIQYVYIILKSESLYDAFNNLNFIWKVIKLDRKLIDEAKQKEEEIKLEKEKLSLALEGQLLSKKNIVEKQEILLVKQDEVVIKKEAQESVLFDLQSLEGEKSNLIASLEEKGENLESQIGDLVAYNKEIMQQIDDLFNDLNNSAGNNKPPVSEEVDFLRPSSGFITDTFGPRINPVTGQAGYHNGIDYAANFNEPIVSTKSGVIEYSGWISGYGNTIIINHGGGIQSLYGHANSLIGTVGQRVAQGELIAYIGSTGMSTGPHLHFEIRINGKPVDPYIYIPY